ncbi:hypothetical protein VTK73DRAFT_7058 [Phialemonium thermophilum]|uniref:ATP-dependent bile acid permease n=1 Tax=Phialemonium thermophilum TaxID=223376 RepID=A0ABR3WGK5_9PEZI
MGFASCSWPIWRTDDFTPCFQHDYLQVLLPLLAICLSFVHLSVQNVARLVRRKYEQSHSYARIDRDEPNSALSHTGLPPDEQEEVPSESDAGVGDDDLLIRDGRLTLTKTATRGSVVQADAPPAQTLSVVVEEVAILCLVAINVVGLAQGSFGEGRRGRLAAVAGLAVWLYVLALVTLRLLLENTRLQWLFLLAVFRSALIHPVPRWTRALVVAEFALSSLLFAMAISTRKGNKTVLLEWEDGIEPSRENLASLFSRYTFSWVDAIVWAGYKQPLDMTKVWNLLPRDKAAAVLAHYRRARRTSKLAVHLLTYFKGMLLAQAAWAVMSGVFTFAPTLLLKAILEYIEDPAQAPRNVLWLYVILLPICINLRAILVGEIYAKALRRKAAAGNDSVLGVGKGGSSKSDKKSTGFLARIKRAVGLGKKDEDKGGASQNGGGQAAPAAPEALQVGQGRKTEPGADEQANLGTIINLMSVDSFKVSEVTAYLHFLIASAPTQLLVSVVLLYKVMGLSAIPGFVVMAALLPINIAYGKAFNSTQKKIMAATDRRIHTTNEVLQNIRIIKAELQALRKRFIIWATAVAVWNTVPILITFFSFLVYTVVEGKPLYPSVAFTAISLFMLLRYPLDQLGDMIAHVQESYVSIDRIEEFLSEEETEKFEQLGADNLDEHGNRVIGFEDASFIWGGRNVVSEDGSMAFRLLDLDVRFRIGGLNVVTGPTGSGKTSLLMALLGEMTILKGRVYLPGGRSREDAWLVNGTVKENILFSSPLDERRYRDVIVACALERDLEILDHGDETLVGEKGITLSGGQKQRISLARAVYSNSRHLLLDDCLSAVDSHTAQWIFNNCIMGPLMRHRTCILVSHNVPLCVPFSDFVVTMNNGRVDAQGPPAELIAAGKFGEELQQKSASHVGDESGDTLVNGDAAARGNAENLSKPRVAKKGTTKDAMEEEKAVGAVKWPVMKLYLRSMGGWWFWTLAFAAFGVQQLSSVASNVWIKEWANQYTEERTSSRIEFGVSSYGGYSTAPSLSPTYFASIAGYVRGGGSGSVFGTAAVEGGSGGGGTTGVNPHYYLAVLAVIGIAGALSALLRDLWIFLGSLSASWKLHKQLMSAMMNRFSKDLEAIDQEVAPISIGVMSCALGIVVTIVLIAVITPGFLIAAFFITVAYCFLGAFYIHSSRDLKRLESVQRSPLFQQFGETLTGVTTIRAYGDERRFVRDNLARINAQQRPFIYLWAANRWLAFRTDLLGDLVAFFAGVFVILSLGRIDPGSAGISLSYAIGFAENILWLVRLYSMNEQNMNSVERIKEYLDVEQEAPAFVDYTTRYRPELEPVLRHLSFKIQAREKVGIVGRTGAGKSSLTLALFRGLEADEGRILIDDVDISAIGLRDLREAITIVPQEPTLFMGTIRSNLDPFQTYTDEEVFRALRRVQLIGPDESTTGTPAGGASGTSTPARQQQQQQQQGDGGNQQLSGTNRNIFLDLSTPVTESGSNLSQGQRQLLCLARALLKEPTGTIRELDSTIVTIAHRLQTIADYDKVLVLDRGELVEFGHPWELMRKRDGLFRSMCDMSGDYEVLARAARKAWAEKRLVDVDAEDEEEEEGREGESGGDVKSGAA